MAGAVSSDDLPTFVIEGSVRLAIALVQAGLARSNSEARRLVAGGGVRVDGAKADDPEIVFDPVSLANGVVVRVGKARAVRLLSNATKG